MARASLVVAAQPAGRSTKCAAVAVGHALLLAADYILTDHRPYDERLHVPKPPRPASPTHLVQQLYALGYEVAIHPIDPAA